VADHVLGHEHRDVLPAVVDGDRETNHFGDDHRTTRPGLDRLAIILGSGYLDLFYKVEIDERTFFQ
jgi:hypothetical protein